MKKYLMENTQAADSSAPLPWPQKFSTQRSRSTSPEPSPMECSGDRKKVFALSRPSTWGGGGKVAVKLTDGEYLNIMESMGQSVHIFDHSSRVIYWNRAAEELYGYSAAEALGEDIVHLLVETKDYMAAKHIVNRLISGDYWTGLFPVRNKIGERFVVFVTNTPFYDDNGTIVGILVITCNSQLFKEFIAETDSPNLGCDTQPSTQVVITSKISDWASKVSNKVKSRISTPQGGDVKHVISKMITSKAEAWVNKKKNILWPWKGNQEEEEEEDPEGLDFKISWDDLKIGEQIGQGPRGIVYHALWYGWDVAVKVFSKQNYSDDVIHSCKGELSYMTRLCHPNIVVLMGAVMSPQHLCIVTEFFPRGSLFSLLHHNSSNLDWKQQIHMALDIAHGMNYLHNCNPPIIHHDLKSLNLLVHENGTVKVGEFGVSQLKYESYLKTKRGKETTRWMAPEAFRGEPLDEKANIYSFGVVLWELTTRKIPWENLNSMQVIGAVGFMNHRLEIPKEIDPEWASLIQSCWHREPKCRPTFQELVCCLEAIQL